MLLRPDRQFTVVTSHISQTCQQARRAILTYSILQLILMINDSSHLFILCINTGNFYSVFSSLQDVITCTYMTCKNKVNKTPVHRLSSILQ